MLRHTKAYRSVLAVMAATMFSAGAMAGTTVGSASGAPRLAAPMSQINSVAAANKPSAVLRRILDDSPVQKVVPLSTAGGLVAIKAKGKFYIMSKNGRFIFDGTLRDTWQNGRIIGSMSDVENYATRLNLANLGIDFTDVTAITYGKGPGKAAIFVETDCSACEKALSQMMSLGNQYTFRVVVIPHSMKDRVAEMISCETNDTTRLAILRSRSPRRIPATGKPLCKGSQGRMLSTLMLSQLLGASKVPFIVTPDGRVSNGLPTKVTLSDFLAGASLVGNAK